MHTERKGETDGQKHRGIRCIAEEKNNIYDELKHAEQASGIAHMRNDAFCFTSSKALINTIRFESPSETYTHKKTPCTKSFPFSSF